MNTSEPNRCPRCQAVVPASSGEALCPACLMSGALDRTATELPGTLQPSRDDGPGFPFDFGGYRILGFLGSGGMGTVYEAEQLATGRRVALKMLSQQLDSQELRRRFLREGRLAAGVNHPNSLYIYGSEEVEGVPVITMEIAGGGTLRDRLKKRGPMPVAEAVDAVLDVIAGLEAAHAGGVLHRDVKPSNCFLGPDGSVKIGDYGLSVSTLAGDDSHLTATGAVMGTPAYAPPEQLRGDDLDVRADIYSVGATLFTLISGQAPFTGRNAVQVVANAVNAKPAPLTELRDDVPAGLAQVVARCLAKEPGDRYAGYMELRNALLPFSSLEPQPASMKVRATAGWVDYLMAFLLPYMALMLAVGNETFHLGFLMERTLYSARHYLAFLAFGLAYFALAEGIWSGGPGKRWKGLMVVRNDGRRPGIPRAFLRIFLQIASIEIVRIPLLLATIKATSVDTLTTTEGIIYSVVTSLCPTLASLLALRARKENRYTTLWDRLSGTRVVIRPRGARRQPVQAPSLPDPAGDAAPEFGPYRILESIDEDRWLLALDPVLRRPVWLLRRTAMEPRRERRELARPGRLRWLQEVDHDGAAWDAFEAIPGVPFTTLAGGGKQVPWTRLRHWLHDLAGELWAASGDGSLPDRLSLDHVWITGDGRAILLDQPWPGAAAPATPVPVQDIAGQQRFLASMAATVDSTGLPLHARPVLQNLKKGRFEKLSYLTGNLQGILERPAEVGTAVRAGAMYMFPLYAWIMVVLGVHRGADWLYRAIGGDGAWAALAAAVVVLTVAAVSHLVTVPFRTSSSYSLFRLALIDEQGEPAKAPALLARWGIIWLPLLAPLLSAALLVDSRSTAVLVAMFAWIAAWIALSLFAIRRPSRGLQDRLSKTWVVRQ